MSLSLTNASTENLSERPNLHSDYLFLFLLYAILVAGKLLLVRGAATAFNFGDEFLYKTVSESLFMGNGYTVRGVSFSTYPPLYPITLAPSFLSVDAWYEWMLAINVFLSSALIFPIWWVARVLLPKRQGWFCVLVASVIPYHIVFPRMILSENLFLPLFLVAFYLLLLDSYGAPRLQYFGTGIVWGMCLLTRHIFSAALPVFVAAWWVQPWLKGIIPLRGLFCRERFRSAVFLALGFGLMYMPWLFYSAFGGLSIPQAMGFASAGEQLNRRVFDSVTLMGALLPWIAVFLSSLVLMISPYLHLIVIYLFALARKLDYQVSFFSLALAGLTGVLLVTATTFLWRFFGNRWSQAYVEERYISPVVPLLPIFGFLVLNRLKVLSLKMRCRAAMIGSGISAVLVFGAYILLVSNAIWSGPMSSYPITSMYSATFHPSGYPFVGGLLAVYFAMLIVQNVYLFVPSKYTMALALIGLIAFYSLGDWALTGSMNWLQERNRHGRVLASLLLKSKLNSNPVQIFFDPKILIVPSQIESVIKFWNVPSGSFAVREYPLESDVPNAGFLVTAAEYLDPLVTYHVGGDVNHVYGLPILAKEPFAIREYGPTETEARQGFNIQSDGNSAMWIKTANATPNTVVIFNGIKLLTSYVSPDFLTVLVPKESFATPGRWQFYLFDPFTRAQSNSAEFTVR